MPSRLHIWGSAAATAAVLTLAYGPLLVEFFQNQWDQPQYQFFPFVLGAFGWLLWRSCSQSRPKQAVASTAGRPAMMVLLMAALGLLVVAYVAHSPWLAIISAILLVASGLTRVAAAWQVEYLWGVWALLWLMVPLPLGRDRVLVSWLQTQSSRLSSFFLDCLGVHHLMDGNALRLPDRELFVDEACSGIVSVMTVIACAVIYGIWRNRAPLHVVLLALAGIGWATLMNVARITSIAVAQDNWGVDWSAGTPHDILGLIVFTITFLMLVSTDYFLIALLAPIVSVGDEQGGLPIRIGKRIVGWFDALQAWGAPRTVKVPAPTSGRPQSHYELWSRLVLGIVPLLAFAALAGAQFTVSQWFVGRLPPAPHSMEQALAMGEASLPAEIGPLQRVAFEAQERHRDDISGQYSRVFRYRDEEGNEYLMSCDFPFGPDWHELTVCYTSVGWLMAEAPEVQTASAAGEPNWGFVEVRFAKPEGSGGLLVYAAFDEHGLCVAPPARTLVGDIWDSLTKKQRALQGGTLFQVQVWTTSAGPVGKEQAAKARELLLAVRDQIRQTVTKTQHTGDATVKNAG
jgi:exosortase